MMRLALPRLALLRANDAGLMIATPATEAVVIGAAYHVAAHLVVGVASGKRPQLATIERCPPSRPTGWGGVRWSGIRLVPGVLRELIARNDAHSRSHRKSVEGDIMTSLAGHVEEAVRDVRIDLHELLASAMEEEAAAGDAPAQVGDVSDAFARLSALEGDESGRWQELVALAARVERYLLNPLVAAEVELVAEALLEHGTLEGSRLDELVPKIRRDVAP